MDFRTLENENLPPLSSTPTEVPLPKYPIWTVEYFQKYFDVTSEDVLERIKGALIPTYGVNYLQRYIRAKPDVYGPFWICLTLVFSIAISGNVANYIQVAADHDYHWKYNFHAVSSAATAIFLYAWLLPLMLWAFVKYKEPQFNLSYLELLCLYGYSLSIFVPISILWVIQINWLQWLLVAAGTLVSGYVIVFSIMPSLGQKPFAFIFLITILHLFMGTGFMLYFFHVPPIQKS
ncbi:protein YIPF1 [Acyrthosiphon pisum]|uniref:Protein YIPF n=2 Tax=Aphidinae TaxID=133076 RepID=C4WUE3_ACYPI|nr:protein YIPF1 [Acyrthosiphon pisum]XP_027854448.1 protein YIPF1 [Aphis gossypii]BAH71513.1 ACYPI003613 [Acyrthosiphon pisum]CAH1725353.1 unnamed protein product [Aphis gossypii]|eukprot:NP_001155537.1 protein YIPF1 [Acyrthosiphon pisum]